MGVDVGVDVDVLASVGGGGDEIPHAGLQRGGTHGDRDLFPFPFTSLLFVPGTVDASGDALLRIYACACASEDTVVGSSEAGIGGGGI